MTIRKQSGFVEVHGGKLYYEVAGEGHPFVLIHGGLVDSGMWDDQFEVFAQHYRVIRYDIPGFGKAIITDPKATFVLHEQLYSLLTLLGVEKTYIMGLSLGGKIAIDFTLAYPAMVDALIAAAAGVNGYNFSATDEQLSAAAEVALKRGDIAYVVELENRMWTDGPRRTPDQVNPRVRERVREMNIHNYELQAGFEDIPPQAVEPPAISRLSEIHVPTLVIVGDQDVPDMLTIADKLAAEIPNAKKVIIPDTAHHLNMEKPAEFNHIVLEFLEQL